MDIQPILPVNSITKPLKINPDDKGKKKNAPVVKKKQGSNNTTQNEETDAEHIDEFV